MYAEDSYDYDPIQTWQWGCKLCSRVQMIFGNSKVVEEFGDQHARELHGLEMTPDETYEPEPEKVRDYVEVRHLRDSSAGQTTKSITYHHKDCALLVGLRSRDADPMTEALSSFSTAAPDEFQTSSRPPVKICKRCLPDGAPQ